MLAFWYYLIGFVPVCFFCGKNLCRYVFTALLYFNGRIWLDSLGKNRQRFVRKKGVAGDKTQVKTRYVVADANFTFMAINS